MDDVSRAEGPPGDDPTWLPEEIGASPTVLIAPLGAAIQSAEIDRNSGAADDDIDEAPDESGSSTEQERPSGGWWRRFTSGPLWHHADFRRLWVGDTASQLGVAVGGLAIPYLAVHILAATEFQMGLLATLASLGFLLVALPAGAWVDRGASDT